MTILESTSERLEDALRRLAVEASDLFGELLASGAELPFDLEASYDDGPLPMYSYAPLTAEFIDRHRGELRRLEAFLEVRDMSSEEVAIGFLVGLWEGRSEFDVAGDRLAGAIDGVLASVSTAAGSATAVGEVIVPLVGFHMPADEAELDGVRLVRSTVIDDAPLEAVETAKFMACVSCGFAEVAPAAAVADDLQRAVRTLRLFRPGAVGLAAYGWARRADGWERFGTGAARPRNGGYRLTGNEVPDLEAFSRTLTKRGARMPALTWAISRFDLGVERPSLIEALSDYLLALRGMLEGGGPAKAGLSARVAALTCATASEREEARVALERAMQLERKLMSGARYRPAADASPLAVIAQVEELLRRLLKGMATGELGGDLRAAADERLLTEGLAGAGAVIGDELFDVASEADPGDGEIDVRRTGEDVQREEKGVPPETEGTTTRIVVTDVELPHIMGAEEHPAGTSPFEPAVAEPDAAEPGVAEPGVAEPGPKADWFASPDGEVEWPAFASPRRKRGKQAELTAEASDRVRYLFPVPDATDWDVGELRYDSKRAH